MTHDSCVSDIVGYDMCVSHLIVTCTHANLLMCHSPHVLICMPQSHRATECVCITYIHKYVYIYMWLSRDVVICMSHVMAHVLIRDISF